MSQPKFFEEWSEDCDIPWRLKGRQKLNHVIRSFNSYQRDALAGEADPKAKKRLLALIEEGRQTWASRDGGDYWLEVLDKMKASLDDSEAP